jgi:hypothetical protein
MGVCLFVLSSDAILTIPAADVRRMVGFGLEDLLARALGICVEHADRQARIVEGVRLFRERYDQV